MVSTLVCALIWVADRRKTGANNASAAIVVFDKNLYRRSMQHTRFDQQLLRVFTFIVSLSFLVSLMAIASNLYQSGQQRSLIQNNLPAAGLARTISDSSVFIAALAPSFSEVGNLNDLQALVKNLQTEMDGLQSDFQDLGRLDVFPSQHDGVELLEKLRSSVTQLASVAENRLEQRRTLESRLLNISNILAEMQDILASQLDIARVRVTATIADLYAQPDGEARHILDSLADRDFFAYDRQVELGRTVDVVGVLLMQATTSSDAQSLAIQRQKLSEELDFAGRRLDYFFSATSMERVEELMILLRAELHDNGSYDLQERLLLGNDIMSGLLSSIRGDVAALMMFSDELFLRLQTSAEQSQKRTETLARRISVGLALMLLLATAASVSIWQFARRKVVGRLRGVAEHIEALAHEDYGREIPVSGTDEIGEMEKALSILRGRAAKARQLRDELEDTVRKRTGDIVTEMRPMMSRVPMPKRPIARNPSFWR